MCRIYRCDFVKMDPTLKTRVATCFSVSARTISRARGALAAVVRQAGVRQKFAVNVSESGDSPDYEVIVTDLGRMQSKLYGGGNQWVSQFARDLVEGTFSDHGAKRSATRDNSRI
jgi:hypothetical protein